MPINVETINRPQAEKLINLEEGQFADVKAIESRPGKLTEDISAFANADGGELYIGIDQIDAGGIKSRAWRGFADPEGANAHLQVFDNRFPLGPEFQYEFLKCEGLTGILLHVLVGKTKGVILASNSVPYLRRGAQSIPQNAPELRKRLEYSKGVHSFENDLTNAEKEFVTNSEIVLEFIHDVVPTAEPEEYLRKQSLIKEEKTTVAAVLLFADEPQATPDQLAQSVRPLGESNI